MGRLMRRLGAQPAPAKALGHAHILPGRWESLSALQGGEEEGPTPQAWEGEVGGRRPGIPHLAPDPLRPQGRRGRGHFLFRSSLPRNVHAPARKRGSAPPAGPPYRPRCPCRWPAVRPNRADGYRSPRCHPDRPPERNADKACPQQEARSLPPHTRSPDQSRDVALAAGVPENPLPEWLRKHFPAGRASRRYNRLDADAGSAEDPSRH